MEITVIIPTYKPQEYIFECLDSLASQTFPYEMFELLIILNGCNEPYYSRIKEYLSAKKAFNARLVQTDTPGVSNARNIALDMAKGKYIAFIDDDDHVSPLYLEELYTKAAEDTLTLCRPSAFLDGNPAPVAYRPAELYDILAQKGRQSLVSARKLLHTTWMKLIPRKIIGNRRFDKKFSVGEDTLMMFMISDKIKQIDFASEKAVYYRRIRKDSVLSKYQKSAVSDRIRNRFSLIWQYTRIYFSGIGRYSFIFYLTRIWGALHSVFKT